MQQLIIPDQTIHAKEAGPIVLALGFVIAMGGIATAAIIVCGWGRVKSFGINWQRYTAEIVCR